MTEYALYKADELLIIGTVDELAEFQILNGLWRNRRRLESENIGCLLR
ncbi:TPA: hypothetical protein ACHSF7_003194 [Listeria monocytogenes]